MSTARVIAFLKKIVRKLSPLINSIDAAVLALIVALVIRAHDRLWPPARPIVLAETDSAMLCTFAAALDNPEVFTKDFVLNDPSNFDFYATLHVPLLRLLNNVTHDYGYAFLLPMVPLMLIQLVGFYLLGRVLYKNRYAALLLALSCFFIFKISSLSTFWGINGNTTARCWFQAFLPYVLSGAIYFRGKPERWLWVMAGMGALIYAHPVATPGWAVAVWAGLWFCFPRDWTFWERFRWMFVCGLTFLIVAAPFVIKYLTVHAHGEAPDVELIRKILKYRFMPGYSNLANSVVSVMRQIVKSGAVMLALVSFVVTWAVARKERYKLKAMLAWAVSLVLFAAVIPIYEHDWAVANDRVPFEYDLIRNLRFLAALMMISIFWPVALVAKARGASAGTRLIASALVGVFIYSVLLLRYPTRALFEKGDSVSERFEKWKVDPPERRYADSLLPESAIRAREVAEEKARARRRAAHRAKYKARVAALLFVRHRTPDKATFMSNSKHDGLYVRYIGFRPVVHNWKDGGILAYSNLEKLERWYKDSVKVRRSKTFAKLSEQARRLGAQYIFYAGGVPEQDVTEQDATIVYRNPHFMVLRLD